MATKVEQRSYEDALGWLREHGFDLIEAPGTQGRVFLKKYSCSAAIQKNGGEQVKIFAYPGYLIGSEISKLVNKGYQQFLKTAKTEVGYLEKTEMDAILAQPDRRTSLGNRDHALLLFLYNSGARADEAAKLTIDNLQLGLQPSVRLHGKGNKFRTCPLWPITATSLSKLVATFSPPSPRSTP